MTNFEKYKDDLMKIEGSFAFDKNTKKIGGCDTTDNIKSCVDCDDCIFDKSNCYESDKIKWLYEDYEEPILAEKEKELIKTINSIRPKDYKFRYITRDINNDVFLFSLKPYLKVEDKTYDSRIFDSTGDCMMVDPNLFENITSETGVFDIKLNKFIEV